MHHDTSAYALLLESLHTAAIKSSAAACMRTYVREGGEVLLVLSRVLQCTPGTAASLLVS